MSQARRRTGIAGPLACVAALACHAAAPDVPGGGAQVRTAITHDLPAMDGGRLEATALEVTYGPGASSPPHTHPCPVIGYVLDGALRTQVRAHAGRP